MDINKILSELTLEEKAGLCSGYDFWHTKPVERLGIPKVMLCDGPHGLRKQKGEGDHLGINESIETVCYPTASALAASFDRGVLEKLGEVLGQECQAENVGMLLGPGLNMKRSPLCGRNFEYFSEDPFLAGELGAAYVSSLQKQGVAACVKHFAANNQETRRMSGTSNVDERTLHEIYFPAFEKTVKAGKVRAIMCAYNALNGEFCSVNKYLLTDILRERWRYDGMVVTDWGAVKDRVDGLGAGLDLEMPGGPGVQDSKIVTAVKNGTLDESVLDKAVLNVLKFISDYKDQRQENMEIDRAAFGKLSGELEAQCAVLLKNDGVLPLNEAGQAAFIGEFAVRPRYQGAGSSHINVPVVTGALKAAQEKGYNVSYAKGYETHPGKNAEDLINEAVALAKKVQTAVIFAGLPDAFESEGGDRDSLEIPENQNRLIEAVAQVQPNTVVVLHGGAPMVLPWLDQVKAVLCMYLGGEKTGTAAVELLYGERVPCGKLAETWPIQLEDNPSYLNFPGDEGVVNYREGIYIGYRYYDKKHMNVLFPFGYGLSYTTFEYFDLVLDKQSMAEDEILTVKCKIKNTGAYKAREAVQLYVSDLQSSISRPVRELKGFEKLELLPGEEKTVTFQLDQRAFAYYDVRIHDWFVESGEFLIQIGTSSRDIRLSEKVYVSGLKEIPMTYDYNSTISDLMKSKKGREFVERMLGRGRGDADDPENANNKAMGEGSEKIVQSMMAEMPLLSIVTFGRMTREELDRLIEELNFSEIR